MFEVQKNLPCRLDFSGIILNEINEKLLILGKAYRNERLVRERIQKNSFT